ncbi:MAG TPA: calcium-binding protein [Solirubrobacteraceae bacterium]
MTHPTKRIATILGVAAALAAPASAGAATLHYEGPTDQEILVLTASPGEVNNMSIQDHDVDGAVTLYDAGTTFTLDTPYCKDMETGYGQAVCPAPNGMRLDLRDGDDYVVVSSGVTEPVTMLGGDGRDRLEGYEHAVVLDGGAGDDKLVGSAENDQLDGGEGNDEVEGNAGSDRLLGGGGDDVLRPDGYEDPAADVVDGGAGTDEIVSEWSTRRTGDAEPLLNVTLGGDADDGRPGEGDDVRGVERLTMSKGGRFVGTDAAEYVKLHQVGDDGELIGLGGDDELRGGDGRDAIDGGAGDDKLDGGFGDDTIVGGPGRDTISADLAGGDCGPLWCKVPYGNDLVDARDGEIDSITCGAGTDAVKADANDTVAPDCEQVDRAQAPVVDGPQNQQGGQPIARNACATVKVKRLTLPRAKRRLAKGGCTSRVAVRRVKHRRVKRGRVVRTIVRPGRVVLVVSRGR